MPSLRPVIAIVAGSHSADSTSTFVVASSQPVRAPPMTPAIDTGPSSSAITTTEASSAWVRPSRASSVSPATPRRTTRLPRTLSASKTWSGRARSKVMKLVTSTSALIGRAPMARNRVRSQAGLGALRTSAMRRTANAGARASSSRSMLTATGQGASARTGTTDGVVRRPSPAAARSRAMPATPAASGRFGVRLISMTGVVEAGEGGVGRADRRVVGQLQDAVVVLGEFEFGGRAQHPVRGDAANDAGAQHELLAGDPGADRREHRTQAGPRVGRAADDLDRCAAGVHHADPQPVGVGVLLGAHDAGHDETLQRGGRIVDALDLQADPGQGLDDRGQLGPRFEVILQPAERELHGISDRVPIAGHLR